MGGNFTPNNSMLAIPLIPIGDRDTFAVAEMFAIPRSIEINCSICWILAS